MSAQVIPLPTAAREYIRLRRAGRRWAVDLVTPSPGFGLRPLSTTLARSSSRDAAVAYAKETGERMKRPVRLPRGIEP
jgi:hypothetical protein